MTDTICLVDPDTIRLFDADTIYLTCPSGETTTSPPGGSGARRTANARAAALADAARFRHAREENEILVLI